MLLIKDKYHDNLSKITYSLPHNIDDDKKFITIKGENGVGKTRFIEGVLLKELKKEKKKVLYFGQDLENQILSFNLISLVKDFVNSLRNQKSFFKTIFLNDDSHKSIELDFNEESTLNPDNTSKKAFILDECSKYENLDIIIFDEVDKYFPSSQQFFNFIENIDVKNIIIISHIISEELPTIFLKKTALEVNIELFNF